MTASRKDRLDFIMHFREQFPERGREECIRAANLILRHAATHARLAEEACNGHPIQQQCPPLGCDMPAYNARVNKLQDAWDARIEKGEARAEQRIEAICAQFGLKPDFGGDPRGYTVKLHLPDGRGNTWGGAESGWGVPS